MKQKKYLWALYLIITTILVSIVVQVYWNYKNYQKNKQLFINQVQISLDNAIDVYYADFAKSDTFLFNKESDIIIMDNDPFFINSKNNKKRLSITVKRFDTIEITETQKLLKSKNELKKILKEKFQKQDSLHDKKIIKDITSIYFSITEDNLDLKKLEKVLKTEFNRKKIKIPYAINHYKNNKLVATNDSIPKFKKLIQTFSKSTYLKKNEKIELIFPNQTAAILKQGLLGILLSLLVSIIIIASLFYLLYIIKQQKEIAEIKNDFINNITHEFKTPITTIGIAIESIKDFNATGNKEKTEEYLSITNTQLKKLNLMVEKVLETSTLDSQELFLQKENIDYIELINKVIHKHKLTAQHKEMKFNPGTTNETIYVDPFHFENVINNLVDNALKYGGNLIEINLHTSTNNLEINISDSGSIPKQQKDKIFDKFYRIPQGNIHNVKGFGIGLYYAKVIVEKHNGTLKLLNTKNTTFQIQLPL